VAHAPHHHPDEEIIVVKEGRLQATIKGVAQPAAGPGSVFFYASNDLHGMKNAGPDSCTYYVMRFVTAATPKP
jgi:quercetin dioxygenase-like cupin family protein